MPIGLCTLTFESAKPNLCSRSRLVFLHQVAYQAIFWRTPIFISSISISFAEIMAPKPKCIVCSEKPQVVVKIDTNRVTVKQFRDDVLVKALNMIEPDVITEGKGLVLISSEEGETDCNNDKKLCELDVVDGCILKVDDFVQQYELTVIITHKEVEREGDLFEIIADPDSLKPDNDAEEKKEAEKEQDNGEPKAKKARHDPKEDSDDDLFIIEDGENDLNRPTTSAASAAPATSVTSATSTASTVSASGSESKQATDNDDVCFVSEEKMDVDAAPSTSSEGRNKRSRIEKEDDDLIVIDSD